jgi:hypothetical protein
MRRRRISLVALLSLLGGLVPLALLTGSAPAASAFTPVPHGVPARPPAPPSPDPSLTDHQLAYAPGPLDNPDKGLAVYYNAGNNQNTGYPHSITWSYFPL